MICGYENIYDLCSNKYSYTYANIIEQNGFAVADSGLYSSVYRTNLSDNTIILLDYNNPINIDTCDINDDNEGLNSWDCYQIYKNENKPINNPPIALYKNVQFQIVNEQHNKLINAGILINIDNFITNVIEYNNGAYTNTSPEDFSNYTIHLPASEEDIINMSNILSQATLSNQLSSSVTLTPLLDFNSKAHFLNYLNLVNILSNYFNKIKKYTELKDSLLSDIINADSVEDIQKCTFYGNKPSSTVGDGSTIDDYITKFSTLDCDPPTGCVDNSDCWFCYYETGCGGTQECCDGIYPGSILVNGSCVWYFPGDPDIPEASRIDYCNNTYPYAELLSYTTTIAGFCCDGQCQPNAC